MMIFFRIGDTIGRFYSVKIDMLFIISFLIQRSLVLVTTGSLDEKTNDKKHVYFYRIEPTNGITDPKKYHHEKIQLIQDDDVFYATCCNIGTFGVVYSVVIDVMQAYWLQEDRNIHSLDQILELLKPNPKNPKSMPDILKNNRHVQFLVHPYPLENDKEVIEFDPKLIQEIHPHIKVAMIIRNIVPKPTGVHVKKGHRNILMSFLQKMRLTFEALVTLINFNPQITPFLISKSMESLVDVAYINRSHEVFVMGYNQDAGYASEMAYPLQTKNGDYTDEYIRGSIERVITVAQKARLGGFQYHTSGFQVRFVNSSLCPMSMMNERMTVILEYDILAGSTGGHEIIRRLESEMYDLNGRPHWGLDLDWINGSIRDLYPNFEKWFKFFKLFNREGTFNNSFTNRLGLWQYPFS